MIRSTAFFLAATVALPAHASSLLEFRAPGGDFADMPATAAPASTATTITGDQDAVRETDIFAFAARDFQSFHIATKNPGGTYGGVNLRLKSGPFTGPHDWYPLVAERTITPITQDNPYAETIDISGADRDRDLFVMIDFFDADLRDGRGVTYTATTQPGAAAIPLPATLPLLIAAMGLLLALRRRA